jgi:hypothetical protein
VLDEAAVNRWCERSLGSRPARVLFRAGHLARVTGVVLADGRAVVVKARPWAPRIAACMAVQAHLAAAGFPCPAPLAGPEVIGGVGVSAEAFVPGGAQLSPGSGAGPFAALLARLVAEAPPAAAVPGLAPSPPWAGWDHAGPGLWPGRDDRGRDLNQVPGPAWVDDAARHVRERLADYPARLQVGHGDFESQNIAWHEGRRQRAVPRPGQHHEHSSGPAPAADRQDHDARPDDERHGSKP